MVGADSTTTDEEDVMAMQNPPHPGGIVKRQCLEPLGLSVTKAAEGIGVTRQALSELVNERTGVSVEMAVRLSKAFGSTPETWQCSRRQPSATRTESIEWRSSRSPAFMICPGSSWPTATSTSHAMAERLRRSMPVSMPISSSR